MSELADKIEAAAGAGSPTSGISVEELNLYRAMGLDPERPAVQLAIAMCSRYGLDLMRKHIVVTDQDEALITRDGYLHVAHESGQFDGMEVLDLAEHDDGWSARVAVYRKDMSHPFTYQGRYPDSGAYAEHGPEMAVKCAEVAALRRAFNVTGAPAADERWDIETTDTTGATD